MPEETRPVHPVRRPALRSRRAQVLGGLVLVALIAAVFLLVDAMRQAAVTITINGTAYHVRTRADTVGAALDDAGIHVDTEDIVWPPLDSPLTDGDAIAIHKAAAVAMQSDDGVRHIRTQAAHPLAILAEQDIVPGPHDIVQVNGQDYSPEELAAQNWSTPPQSIRVVRGVPITVVDGDQTLTAHTTEVDVGRALDAIGVKLYLADRVTPALHAPITPDMTIRITRSLPITVVADGKQVAARAIGPTVADALTAIGLAPVGQDYTIPPLDTPLEPGMTIELVRVNEEVVTRDEPIPFTTIYHADASLPVDEKRVIQEGVDGVRTRKIRVRYENGKEVSRVVQEEWIARPPTPRMILLGEQVKQP